MHCPTIFDVQRFGFTCLEVDIGLQSCPESRWIHDINDVSSSMVLVVRSKRIVDVAGS
jgi:hypothetical protein